MGPLVAEPRICCKRVDVTAVAAVAAVDATRGG
jgi:hypothetical protein